MIRNVCFDQNPERCWGPGSWRFQHTTDRVRTGLVLPSGWKMCPKEEASFPYHIWERERARHSPNSGQPLRMPNGIWPGSTERIEAKQCCVLMF
jgi:hypothetical protein